MAHFGAKNIERESFGYRGPFVIHADYGKISELGEILQYFPKMIDAGKIGQKKGIFVLTFHYGVIKIVKIHAHDSGLKAFVIYSLRESEVKRSYHGKKDGNERKSALKEGGVWVGSRMWGYRVVWERGERAGVGTVFIIKLFLLHVKFFLKESKIVIFINLTILAYKIFIKIKFQYKLYFIQPIMFLKFYKTYIISLYLN
jgi:hypothetical protein